MMMTRRVEALMANVSVPDGNRAVMNPASMGAPGIGRS